MVARLIFFPLRLPFLILVLLLRSGRNTLSWLRRPGAFYVDLDEELRFDYPARQRRGWRGLLQRRTTSLATLRRRFHRLARDRRVRGLILRPEKIICSGMQPWSRIDELRALLHELRASGKHLIAAGSSWNLEHLALASAAEQRILPPPGDVNPRGLRITNLYFGEALAGLGIEAEVTRRSQYKGALDPLTEARMPPEQREALDALLGDWYAEITDWLAGDLGVPPATIRARIDQGPCGAEQALERGWIDRVLYEDELREWLEKTFDRAPILTWKKAARVLFVPLWQRRSPGARRCGTLRVEGVITRGRSRSLHLPPFSRRTTGLETLRKQVRKARAAKRIQRWYLFIDSPGGDGLAADLMWRELHLLARDKELIAYMASVAASGGYYVATAAGRILAHPTAITGSIGVLGAKLRLDHLLHRLGIGWGEVSRGRFASMGTMMRPHAEHEREVIEEFVGDLYERFKRRVAQARGLSMERVEELARGRIWSGRAAREQGLVDELTRLPELVS